MFLTENYIPFTNLWISLALMHISQLRFFGYTVMKNVSGFFGQLFGTKFGGWIICNGNLTLKLLILSILLEFLSVFVRDRFLFMKNALRDSIGRGLERMGAKLTNWGKTVSTKKPTLDEEGLIQFPKPPSSKPPYNEYVDTANKFIMTGLAGATLWYQVHKDRSQETHSKDMESKANQRQDLKNENIILKQQNENLSRKYNLLEQQYTEVTKSPTTFSVSKTNSTTSEVSVSRGLKDIPQLQNTHPKPVINSVKESFDFESFGASMDFVLEIALFF